MYKVGDTILYTGTGVCKIEEIMQRNFQDNVIDYYILRPISSQNAKVFVPIQNAELVSKMKKILSKKEIYSLIKTMPSSELIWMEHENQRKEKFRMVLKNGDRAELICLIMTLYLKRVDLKEQGKKLNATDDRFLKDAENMFFEEVAYVLNIEQEEVLSMVSKEIEIAEEVSA